MQDIFAQVQRNIDALVEGDVNWSACAAPEQLRSAREGQLTLTFGIDGVIPAEWLGDLPGKRVLCLAGAGGLQGPLLACAGAEVTVLDLSERMRSTDLKPSRIARVRFKLADLLGQNKLFSADKPIRWLCLNCGHVHEGIEAPTLCPVCSHDQGYFARPELAPFTA